MSKEKIKRILDFVPLVILTVSAFILIVTTINNGTGLLWKHIVGLIVLPINFGLFAWRHKVGILALCLTLFLGLLSLLSFSYAIITTTTSIGKTEDSQITVFYGQPIFLLWLLIHFILSGRHYFGIATKGYWKNVFRETKQSAN